MNLNAFFERIAPLLEGRMPHAEAVTSLYGADRAEEKDAARLKIYERFCRNHRFEAVDFVFEATRSAVLQLADARTWEALVEGYFEAHPMHHVELNANGAEFPAYLADPKVRSHLPVWISELAEFEGWEWQTQNALDSSQDSVSGGPLRISSTVELRPFNFDFVTWLETDKSRPPTEAQTVVIFWRDADLHLRRELTTPVELEVLKAVFAGATVSEDARATVQDLVSAGILVGSS